MQIRELNHFDIERLLELEEQFENPWEAKAFELEFESEVTFGIGIDIDNELVAYLFYSEYLDEVNINNFAVDPKYHRQGLGSKLLDCLISKMDNQLLYLEVETTNEKAINLYKKYGLEIISTRKNYYGKDRDAYIMQTQIKRQK